MIFSRFKMTSLLIILLYAISIVAPAIALDYQAGVTKGQFIKYGNFIGTGPSLQAYNDNDWMKYQVIDVNQTRVDLILTGQFKNGTVFLGNGDTWVYDVTLLNRVNGTLASYSPLIAGKLSQYSPLTPYAYDTAYVNETQTQTYLGVSRTVNILNYSSTTENSTNTFTYTYDQDSGMLLETVGESQQTLPIQATLHFSYIITDTNIFGPNAPILGLPQLYFYAAAGAVIAATMAIGAVVLKRKSGKNIHRKR